MPKRKYFTTKQVAKFLHVSYHCVNYWVANGFCCPETNPKGSGNKRRFIFRDIIALKAIKAMRDKGISLWRIRRALKKLAEIMHSSPADVLVGTTLIATPTTIYWKPVDHESLVDLTSNGQMVLAFSVIGLGHSISAQLLSIRRAHQDRSTIEGAIRELLGPPLNIEAGKVSHG